MTFITFFLLLFLRQYYYRHLYLIKCDHKYHVMFNVLEFYAINIHYYNAKRNKYDDITFQNTFHFSGEEKNIIILITF